jgi:hypothetical protein
MIHALKEAWRVLVAHGTMIDVRPLCIDIPLEIVFSGKGKSAGILDLSPDIKRDINSGRAIETILTAGIFMEEKLEFFDFAYYWNTLKKCRKTWMRIGRMKLSFPKQFWGVPKHYSKNSDQSQKFAFVCA